MKEQASGNAPDKELMKALRAERKDAVERATAAARETRKALKAVREHLAGANATIPEIAQAIGLAPDRTLWLVASMRKFGEVVEAEKDGDFYRYALAGATAQPGQE
ncbi:MAG: winged helix-turn-helix domain-containing protein [Desulfovibrio sp.]